MLPRQSSAPRPHLLTLCLPTYLVPKIVYWCLSVSPRMELVAQISGSLLYPCMFCGRPGEPSSHQISLHFPLSAHFDNSFSLLGLHKVKRIHFLRPLLYTQGFLLPSVLLLFLGAKHKIAQNLPSLHHHVACLCPGAKWPEFLGQKNPFSPGVCAQ